MRSLIRSSATRRIAVLLLIAGSARVAAAGNDALAAANEHVALANRAFVAGKHDKAIEELRIAYQLAPRAEFLLSFAQVYRAAGRLQESLEACRSYLRMVPNGAMAAKARELVKILEAEIARSKPPSIAPPPPPAPRVEPPAPPAPRVELAPSLRPGDAVVAAAAVPPPADHRSRRRRVILGVTLGGAGLVVVGVTVGLAVGLTRTDRHPTLGVVDFAPP